MHHSDREADWCSGGWSRPRSCNAGVLLSTGAVSPNRASAVCALQKAGMGLGARSEHPRAKDSMRTGIDSY
jgi:hypothetical protein